MSKILTIDEALQGANAVIIQDALNEFNERGIVDERFFTELKRGVRSPEAVKNFLGLALKKDFVQTFRTPPKITFQ